MPEADRFERSRLGIRYNHSQLRGGLLPEATFESKVASMSRFEDVLDKTLLASIPTAQLARDCPSARIVSVRHRGSIYRQGEAVRLVYCLLEGQVSMARINADGQSLTTALVSPGEIFGPAIAGEALAEESARAKGAVMVWTAPVAEFQQLLRNHPDSAWKLSTALARRQRRMERRLESLAFKPVEIRLAQTFRELSDDFASRCEHGYGQHLRLSQQELADLVGASRPVVSTILNRLRDKGVLNYNREYVCVRSIEDIEGLSNS